MYSAENITLRTSPQGGILHLDVVRPEEVRVNIGDRIRIARKAAGLSQEEVARRAGLSLKGMGDIERGDIEDPHISSLSKIARALGVSVETLIGDEELVLAGGKAEARPHAGPAALKERWESALASVHERQLEIAARVGELVEAPSDEVDPYQVEWALKEAEACEYTLMLALPGSRQGSRLNEIIINPMVFAPEQWEEVRNASRFYDSIVERLVEADLVVLKEREGQRAEPVPVGIGA